jgi:hypothetical protein
MCKSFFSLLVFFQQEEKVLQVRSLVLLLTGCKESELLLMLQKVLSTFMRRFNLP